MHGALHVTPRTPQGQAHPTIGHWTAPTTGPMECRLHATHAAQLIHQRRHLPLHRGIIRRAQGAMRMLRRGLCRGAACLGRRIQPKVSTHCCLQQFAVVAQSRVLKSSQTCGENHHHAHSLLACCTPAAKPSPQPTPTALHTPLRQIQWPFCGS